MVFKAITEADRDIFIQLMTDYYRDGEDADTPQAELDDFIKESLHLVEFAILYFLFVVALGFNGKLTLRTSLIVALISCMYGAIDEIHQSFYPYRSASWFDLLKDCIGVAAVWGHIRYHYFHRKKSVFNRIFPQ